MYTLFIVALSDFSLIIELSDSLVAVPVGFDYIQSRLSQDEDLSLLNINP